MPDHAFAAFPNASPAGNGDSTIVHLAVPDFFTTMEELRNPDFRKRPLALGEPGTRAVVQGVNGIARSEGIREGMPLAFARRLCRRLQVLPPDLRFYRERHQQTMEEFGRFSPLVEDALMGRYFVDLAGTRRLWGPVPDVACRIERHLLDRMGFRARIGLAVNKLVSRVAAGCVPAGDLGLIFPGAETSFLAPLPVTALPGIGLKTGEKLSDFNIRSIGELAALSAESLSGVFGPPGPRLLLLARGVDATPVIPPRETPRLTVARTLDRDEIDRDRLESLLFRMVEEAGWNLRSQNRCPGAFALEIRYADGATVRRERQVPPTAVQSDLELFRALHPVFRELFLRRVALRRMVIEFSRFTRPLRQLSLFPRETFSAARGKQVQEALDGIRVRFGRRAIAWGKGVLAA